MFKLCSVHPGGAPGSVLILGCPTVTPPWRLRGILPPEVWPPCPWWWGWWWWWCWGWGNGESSNLFWTRGKEGGPDVDDPEGSLGGVEACWWLFLPLNKNCGNRGIGETGLGTYPFVEAGEAGLEEIISSIKGECATPWWSSSGLGPGPSSPSALDPPTFNISDIEALTNMFERLLIRRRRRRGRSQKILLKFTTT